MAFSSGLFRLQKMISFLSIDYRTKKEIMAHLRDCDIIISYKTLERDLKQIKDDLGIELNYRRNFGYKCEHPGIKHTLKAAIQTKNEAVGYENNSFKILNRFDYDGKFYCNCLDKSTQKVFLIEESS